MKPSVVGVESLSKFNTHFEHIRVAKNAYIR